MAIKKIMIHDYLVFEGDFSLDFCPGVNIFIGGNGTGKTTLLRCLYDLKTSYAQFVTNDSCKFITADCEKVNVMAETGTGAQECEWGTAVISGETKNYVYIPEKDILEHARGLLTFIEQKETGFNRIYKDFLVNAQDVPTKVKTDLQNRIGQKITDIIGGAVFFNLNDGSFYTLKSDGLKIPFSNEASGFKKLGYLGLLISNGQLEPGSILIWDEPENSLNPELVPILIEILLELSHYGIQIFIATHNYIFSRYFDVRKDKNTEVLFHSLQKTNTNIIINTSKNFLKLPENHIEAANAELFKSVIQDAMAEA